MTAINQTLRSSRILRGALVAIVATAGCLAAGSADAFGFRAPPAPMMRSMPAGIGSPAWTRLHTVAPSHFTAPLKLANPFGGRTAASGNPFFNGAAAGPAGAQFGRMPTSNKSFIDPTRNSRQAHQTQNSVQAQNAQMSTNAVQGRNCNRTAILTGLCQGR